MHMTKTNVIFLLVVGPKFQTYLMPSFVLTEIREDGKECGFSFPLEPIKIHPSKLGGKNVVYMEFTILAILIRDLNL